MADRKLAYGSSADLTITLASLATSSTLVAGRASTAIDNSSNLYLDVLVNGKVTAGTSPTGGFIEVWSYASILDTPAYPDSITGTDAAKTFTSRTILINAMALIAKIPVDTTSDRTYFFGPVSLRSLFGSMPRNWGVFVVHSTGVNLNATGSNQKISYKPLYETIA